MINLTTSEKATEKELPTTVPSWIKTIIKQLSNNGQKRWIKKYKELLKEYEEASGTENNKLVFKFNTELREEITRLKAIRSELKKLYNQKRKNEDNIITNEQYNAILKSAEFATPKELEELEKQIRVLTKYNNNNIINNNSTPKQITKIAASITAENPESVTPRLLERLGLEDNKPNRLRCCDLLYISKKLKREWRKKESDFSFLLSTTAIPSTTLKWVSDLAKRHYEKETKQAEEFAKKYSMISNEGEVISGTKLFDKNTRDKNKYAEEVAVAKGLSILAKEEGNTISALITITLPSEFHPLTTCQKTGRRIKNPKFNGCTIKEAHDHFQHLWALTRANLAHQNNKISHFVRAAQPHKTGVPHYHVTTFLKNEAHLQAVVEELSKQLNQAWVITKNKTYKTATDTSKTDPKIRGIRADIFTDKNGEIDVMGATNYIMASLAYIMPDDSHDEKTGRSSEEVKAIKNWARKNNIRRFTTSHGNRVLWRKLRAADDFNSEAQRHAKSGDYATFYRTLHIVKNDEVIKNGAEYFKTLTVQEINKYGETVEVPDSIIMLNMRTGETHKLDISSKWEIVENEKLTVMDKNQGASAKPRANAEKQTYQKIKINQLQWQ